MNELSQLLAYLEAGQAEALRCAESARADGRGDEAALARVRANIFDAMTAVGRAAGQRAPEAPLAFVRKKLETIPAPWRASLAAAEAHGDFAKAEIERVKLAVAADIGAALQRMEEGGQ